jgi:hypothetical protein
MQSFRLRSGSVEATVLLECDGASLRDLATDVSRQQGGLIFKGPNVHVEWTLEQCFSTAGPRPGTGPWHQVYRAARGLRKLQYATRFY